MQRLLYFIYKLCDHIPIKRIKEYGMMQKIYDNCLLISFPRYNPLLAEPEITNLWHDTFHMICYNILYSGNHLSARIDYKWRNMPYDNKIMKIRASYLRRENDNKDLTAQQWLDLFQNKVRTLPDELGALAQHKHLNDNRVYRDVMYAHWLYRQYIRSLESNK